MSAYVTKWIEALPAVKAREKILGEGKVLEQNKFLIDAETLASDIEAACNQLDADGYEVLTIMPVDRGQQRYDTYAFSITDGVIVTARRKKAE